MGIFYDKMRIFYDKMEIFMINIPKIEKNKKK